MVNPWHPGRFDLNADLVRDFPDDVVNLFAHFNILPVRAEMLYVDNVIRYAAFSPYFEAVPEGVMARSYLFTIEQSDNEPDKYSIKKIDDLA